MGESTAESGPRCGEAEEAKRRPASLLKGEARTEAARRHRAPGDRARAPPFPPFPVDHSHLTHYPVGLVVAVAMSLQTRFAAGLSGDRLAEATQ